LEKRSKSPGERPEKGHFQRMSNAQYNETSEEDAQPINYGRASTKKKNNRQHGNRSKWKIESQPAKEEFDTTVEIFSAPVVRSQQPAGEIEKNLTWEKLI
jgi:hypothetical protein